MHAIAQGYRTVYQRSAVVETLAPETFQKLFRQQLRWAKGSQYNTLRWLGMMSRRCPFAAFHFVADIVTPLVFLGLSIGTLGRHLLHSLGSPVRNFWSPGDYLLGVALLVLGWTLTALVRQFPLIRERPIELLFALPYALLSLLILLPARIMGLCLANSHAASDWGTRDGGGTTPCFDKTPRPWLWRIYPSLIAIVVSLAAAAAALHFAEG